MTSVSKSPPKAPNTPNKTPSSQLVVGYLVKTQQDTSTHKESTQQQKLKAMLSTSVTEKKESDSKLLSQPVTRELIRKVLEHNRNFMEEIGCQMDKQSTETGVNHQTTQG
jgi:hypothetical protein